MYLLTHIYVYTYIYINMYMYIYMYSVPRVICLVQTDPAGDRNSPRRASQLRV